MRVAPSGSYTGTLRVAWIHGDHLGSASLTTDINGTKISEMRYYPFGEVRWISGAMPTDRTFTGQRSENQSAVGTLMDYGARFYVPAIGRFLSADTIVPRPGVPQSLNRYAYGLNNPLKYTDPSGHDVNCSGTDLQCKKDTQQEQWFAYLDKERERCSHGGGANCGAWDQLFGFLLSWAVAPEMVFYDLAVAGREVLLNGPSNTSVPVAVGDIIGTGTLPANQIHFTQDTATKKCIRWNID
jgi:RHS repeat-associated protein